jgi:mono/diheme cytochrome c family protein
MRSLIFVFALVPSLAFAQANPLDGLWKGKCAACHGVDGKAQTAEGKKMLIEDLSTAAWQAKFTDAQIKAVINDGLKRKKGEVAQVMEPYKAKLHPEQIDGLVAYVRGLKK